MRQHVRYLVEDCGYKTPCWIWQLALSDDGYGQVTVDTRHLQAHRFYYEQRFGPIPDGLLLDHLCRVRCCVNPDHLEPVSTLVNTRRGLNCKLSPDDIPTIKESYSQGSSYAKIAARFGVTKQAIFFIVKGKNWKGI
jgi:hypothetical protein